jgi:hypothetical protein
MMKETGNPFSKSSYKSHITVVQQEISCSNNPHRRYHKGDYLGNKNYLKERMEAFYKLVFRVIMMS